MTKDPLTLASPDPRRELFEAFCKVGNGFSAEQVIGAAANLMVNAIRQAHPTRTGALASFDELAFRTRELIADHYDGLGKRRNVFPFDQKIEVPLMDFRKWK